MSLCLLFLDRLYSDLCDAAGVHLYDCQAAAFELDALPFFGDMAEAHEEEAGQRLHAALAGQDPLHLRFEIAQVDAAIHQQGAGSRGEGGQRG